MLYSLTSQSCAILDHCAEPCPALGGVMTGMISWISSLRADLASRVVPYTMWPARENARAVGRPMKPAVSYVAGWSCLSSTADIPEAPRTRTFMMVLVSAVDL